VEKTLGQVHKSNAHLFSIKKKELLKLVLLEITIQIMTGRTWVFQAFLQKHIFHEVARGYFKATILLPTRIWKVINLQTCETMML
jgi:hypothetical protein